MTKFLDRDAILAVADIETREVDVPEWGGSVLVYGLTGQERDRYEQSVMVRRGKRYEMALRDARAKLVVLAVRDEKGKRLFSDGDVEFLTQKSAAALNRVWAAAAELSGLKDEDIEELVGNSNGALNGDSGSV